MTDMLTEITKRVFDSVNAETERWCWKALAQGVGNRVWRSEPKHVGDSIGGYRIVHNFQILTPGEGVPGAGVVFGPFGPEIVHVGGRDE